MARRGIIYATDSNTVRRIVADDNANYDYSLHVEVGESLIVVDGKPPNLFEARLAIEGATGKKSPDPICAVVKNGTVVGVILADPKLDVINGHELVPAYYGVASGQSYDKVTDTFIRPASVILAGIDKHGVQQSEKIIPATPIPKPDK